MSQRIEETLHQENERLRARVAELKAKCERLEAESFQADAERQSAREQFVDVVEFLPDAAFAIDEERRVIAWNRGCEVMTGVAREALLGRGDFAYAEPFFGERRPTLVDLLDQPLAAAEARYRNVKRSGDAVSGESFVPSLRDGAGAYLWGAASLLFDRDGRRRGALEVIRDITEHKQIEQALRENELRYRTLFETAGDAILLMREDRFVDCNTRTLELFGCERDEIVGSVPYQFSPPEQPDGRSSREEALAWIRKAHDEGPQFFEWVHCRADGSPFAAEVSLNCLALGGEVLVQAIVRDVSQRKHIQDALLTSEHEYRELVRLANSIILRWSCDGRVAYMNEFGLRFFGYEAAELVGRHVVGTIVPENESTGRNLRPLMDEICANPEAFERSANENMRRSGERVWIDWTNRVVLDENGEVKEILSIGSDVTERRRLNEALERHTQELEERVQARTAQLAARNQELKDFAYTVSHDLKAPLRGIAGYASELERKHKQGLTERAQFCLKQILTAASHLDELIEDLLHYSRLDAETPTPTAIDLPGLVDAILRDRELALSELRAEVTVDIPISTIHAWERGLTQVLTNLIDNAIKYSRQMKPPRLGIAAACHDEVWQLRVTDNGIGFDMKYHDRIFGLFNRLVRAEDYEGTGAGLAIARKVLDKQGGRIWAASAPGRGATFFVEIPRPRGEDQLPG